MEKSTTIATLKATQKREKQEALEQSKYYKIINWAKTNVWPLVKMTADKILQGADALCRSLSKVRISWLAILALVILANMAKNGMMDDMPNFKWLLESAMRLIEWGIGLLRNLLKWVMKFPGFGIFEWFENWVASMFAL